jgi:protein phosphatase
VAVIALVVLVAGAVGTYVWALGHWFVGVDGTGDSEQVAIFRGLDVSVVGFDFFEVEEDTGLALADLTPAARNRVRGGISATDSDDANRILEALREQRLPVCSSGGPTTSNGPSSPAVPSTGPTTSALPGDPGGVPPTTAETTTASRTTEAQEPGTDCREAD